MCFGPNNLEVRENADSKKHDPASCKSEDEHEAIPVEYKRFVGLTFAPVAPKKYIHTVTVAAPAQFLVEVKLTWDYKFLEPGHLKFLIRNLQNGQPGNNISEKGDIPAKGEYVFSTQKPGQYLFEMQVFDARGKLVHKDFAAAYLDR